MALKAGATSYKKQMIISGRHKRVGVGATYREREAYNKQRASVEAPKSGFLGKLRDFFLGAKLPNVDSFKANAEYVRGNQSISEHHKNLEQGIKSSISPDAELFKILNSIERNYK